MPRSDEAEWWFNAVYEAVQEIPHGHVTSYGHIARLLGKRMSYDRKSLIKTSLPQPPFTSWDGKRLTGTPSSAQRPRQVGICLKHLPTFTPGSSTEHYFHNENVPWQRVVNAKGVISPRGPGAAARQAAALRGEGVRVDTGSLGELAVDLGRFGWFPDMLPSEEAQMGDSGRRES